MYCRSLRAKKTLRRVQSVRGYSIGVLLKVCDGISGEEGVLENRLLEMLIYLIIGIVFLVLGFWSTDVNYQVLFFILTAFFVFAIFRPTSQS
jgi:hypothetical protein